MSDPNREETPEVILTSLVLGEIELSHEKAQALLREGRISEQRIRELRALVAELEDVGEYERELVREAASVETGPDIPVESILRGLQERDVAKTAPAARPPQPGSEPRVPGRKIRLVPPALLAAAALLLCAYWAGLLGGGKDPSPGGSGERPTFLGVEIEILEPRGEVETYGAFRWKLPLKAGGWFEVLVYDDAQEATEPEITGSGELFESRWEPGPEVTKRWPEAIRWEVRAFDSSGFETGFGEATARRPSSD